MLADSAGLFDPDNNFNSLTIADFKSNFASRNNYLILYPLYIEFQRFQYGKVANTSCTLTCMRTYQHPKHVSLKEQKEQDVSDDRSSKTGCWIGFFVGLLLLVVCAIPAHHHTLTGFQLSIFRAINNENLPHVFSTGARYATEILGAGYAIAACVLIPLALKKYRLSWRFFFTAGGTVAVFYVIKKIINEPRPLAMLHGDLHLRAVETGPAFPSGHEAAATALALTLWFVLPKAWRWLPVLWILVVAWSRLFLGVHSPVDVVGGFAIGLMAVCFVRLLPESVSKPLKLDD